MNMIVRFDLLVMDRNMVPANPAVLSIVEIDDLLSDDVHNIGIYEFNALVELLMRCTFEQLFEVERRAGAQSRTVGKI